METHEVQPGAKAWRNGQAFQELVSLAKDAEGLCRIRVRAVLEIGALDMALPECRCAEGDVGRHSEVDVLRRGDFCRAGHRAPCDGHGFAICIEMREWAAGKLFSADHQLLLGTGKLPPGRNVHAEPKKA